MLAAASLSATVPQRVAEDTVAARATGARSRTYLQNFKDMVLSRCIATAYKSSPDAATDANASAGGFFEWSNYDVETFGEVLDAMIAAKLAQPYGSFQGPGVRLDLMKCVDLYHGRALADLARRAVDKPHRRPAQDYPKDE